MSQALVRTSHDFRYVKEEDAYICPAGERLVYHYRWSKEFLGAGKKRLAGDTAREATSEEVKGASSKIDKGPPCIPWRPMATACAST